MLPYLNAEDKAIAEKIIANIQKIYPLFETNMVILIMILGSERSDHAT